MVNIELLVSQRALNNLSMTTRLVTTMAIMAKFDQGLRTQRFGFSANTPTKALIGRTAQLERRTLVFKANVYGGAVPLAPQLVLQKEIRGLGTLQMGKAARSPLRFAVGCFPPCFPGFRARGGEAENDPGGSFSAADLLE